MSMGFKNTRDVCYPLPPYCYFEISSTADNTSSGVILKLIRVVIINIGIKLHVTAIL